MTLSVSRVSRFLNSPGLSLCLVVFSVIAFVSAVLALSGVAPLETFRLLVQGSLGSTVYLGHVLKTFMPLTLCSMGLVYTFRIGIWNIGIEGQIIAGALGGFAFFRLFDTWIWIAFPLALAGSFVAGAFLALMSGLLKTRFGVHEIFAGLGLNFVTQGLTLWLIFGPWKRPGIASMSGTDPIANVFFLSEKGPFALSPFAIALVVVVFFLSWVLIRQTLIGLKLHASGTNPTASRLLGLRPSLSLLFALTVCGGLAGLAGFFQVTGVYHRLIPSISSGYGYLAILVVLLSRYDIRFVPLISFFFSCLNVGSIQLPMVLQIDSSLSGVIQGLVVLFFLLVKSMKDRSVQNQVSNREVSDE